MEKIIKKISIFGCGWLGKPLFKELKTDLHVECFKRDITKGSSSFYGCDILIIAIPPREGYLKTLQDVITLTNSSCKIVLLSSTSVYKEFDGVVDEQTNITDKTLQKNGEELVSSLRDDVIILRLGGLMGGDRVAGKYKTKKPLSDGAVNYVHKDDVIAVIRKLIQKDIKNGIYNLVAPMHPSRKELHLKNAKKFGFELGEFEGFTNRVVSADKIVKELNYKFLYPNPLNMWD